MSFPSYPRYKDSEIEWLGEVPEHWEVQPIKRPFQIVSGSTPKSEIGEYWDGNILWTTPADLSQVGSLYVSETQRTITTAGLESCGTTLVPAGSIVLSTRAPIGSLGIAKTELCTNQGCKSLVPREKGCSEYFAYLLSISSGELNNRGKGTTFLELSADELGAFRIPVPPVLEQRSIVTFLDRETARIDALISEQHRLIELLKEKRQAVISYAVTKGSGFSSQMKFSGFRQIGDIPVHWGVVRLKHVKAPIPNAFVDGPFGSNLKSEHFIDGGEVYVIESGFATQGHLEPENLKTISLTHFQSVRRSEARCGDIIIAKIGAQFGKSSILPPLDRPAVVSGNSLKLTIDSAKCDIEYANMYLSYLKSCGLIDVIVNGSAQPALALGEMNNLPFILPPRDEQLLIVAAAGQRIQSLDTLTAEAEKAINLLQERRTALISAAVTGKIDVRGIAMAEAA